MSQHQSMCNLIRERQRELMARLEGLERAAIADNGGMLPHIECNPIADELKFLVKLTDCYIDDMLSRRHPPEPILSSPPPPPPR